MTIANRILQSVSVILYNRIYIAAVGLFLPAACALGVRYCREFGCLGSYFENYISVKITGTFYDKTNKTPENVRIT